MTNRKNIALKHQAIVKRASAFLLLIFISLKIPLIAASDSLPLLDESEETLLKETSLEEPFFEDIDIDNTEPVFFEIDKAALGKTNNKATKVTIGSDDQQITIDPKLQQDANKPWLTTILNPEQTSKEITNQEKIRFSFSPTDKMVGKKIRVVVDKEDNLSKVAAAGALLPQIIPIIAFSEVTWQPYGYGNALLRWNYLLTGQNLTGSFARLIREQVFQDSASLLAQCSENFIAGFTAYSAGMYGNDFSTNDSTPTTERLKGIEKAPLARTRAEAFRSYMGTTPTNNLLDCVTNVVSSNLQTMHQNGSLQKVFPNDRWQGAINNEDVLNGMAKLMVGYSFNLFANLPGGAVSMIRRDLGMSKSPGIEMDFTSALKTSIQYTLHKGYLQLFSGWGWDGVSSYTLASGVGLLEIAYRLHRVTNMVPADATDNFDELNADLSHQLISIGERAEAIASMSYDFVPIPQNIREYAAPFALSVLTPIAAYYLVDSVINYYAVGGTNLVMQKVFTSATNGLVLGALAYVILPYAQKQAAQLTQQAADKFMAWTDADQSGWIGYFAAKNTHYKISVILL